MSIISERPTEQATERWVVDPVPSSAEFSTPGFWGLATTTGRFSRFDGAYTVGPGGPAIELAIDAGSLDTGNRLRDRHLRSPDFFDVGVHPHVRFTTTEVVDDGDGTLRVAGNLEARGKEIPLEFEAAIRDAAGELEVDAVTAFDHRRLGMTHSPLGMVRSPTTIHVNVRLVPVGSERP